MQKQQIIKLHVVYIHTCTNEHFLANLQDLIPALASLCLVLCSHNNLLFFRVGIYTLYHVIGYEREYNFGTRKSQKAFLQTLKFATWNLGLQPI